ncbi:MAG: response regulator transcription factor [Armatimonadetes bacterium]|nr:response regulator transcription factor [Armatimonadota bacterium]
MSSETEKEGAFEAPSESTHKKRTNLLTEREVEILKLIFAGNPSSDVARALCVSKRTVDFHLSKAYGKLGVSNRVQAFKKVTELGLVL